MSTSTGTRRSTASTRSVLVVGAGINGLVAAAELAGAGWSVTLVERSPRLGGFVAAGEDTLPGYVHDTFSSWHPLFVTGGAYAELGADLHRLGLEYANTDGALTASVADDGRVTLAQRDPGATVADFAHAADASRYGELLDRFGRSVGAVGALLGSELRTPRVLRPVLDLVRRNGRGTEDWLRDTATSGRSFCRREFRGPEVDHLWVPWLLHAGLSPDAASGGLMLPIFAATMHGAGLPVVVGGAGRFLTAFEALLRERGVRILTGADVRRFTLSGRRVTGVELADGSRLAAGTVLAAVTPTALYGELLPPGTAPKAAYQAARYRYGRAAAQIHVALSEPLRWNDARLDEVPLVHLSDGSASTGIACAEAEAGFLPRRPTVVVGQQSRLDPTRAPDGAATLWLQLQELPRTLHGDAAGELDVSRGWTPELTTAWTERVLDRLAVHAPNLHPAVRAVTTITPRDLAERNVNAVDGDPYGGSAELDQNFLWRPLPGHGRHRTPVAGLFHIGAGTHPGPGLGGGSGHLVAQGLIGRSR